MRQTTRRSAESRIDFARPLLYNPAMVRLNIYRGLLVAGIVSAVGLPTLVAIADALDPMVLLVAWLPLCFYVAGMFAFWKRPEHPAAQRLLAVGSLHLVAFALSALIASLPSAVPALWLLNLLSQVCFSLGFAALLALYAVFPDGAYGQRYERVVVQAVVLAAIILPVLHFISRPTQPTIVRSETGVPETASPLWIPALAPLANLYPVIFLAPVAGLILLGFRYRRAPAEQRMQMRWPLASAALLGIALLSSSVVTRLLGERVQALTFILVASSLPATIVIGMLRHRLFDIDLIIRRSLVYGLLWLAIAALYVAATAVLGIAVGQRLPVGVAVVLTIVAAMLFQPARRRLERLADRLVYGDRLSGYDLIRQFGAALENTVDLTELAPRVAATLRRGLDAIWVRVLLQQTQHGRTQISAVGADGIGLHDAARTELAIPLVYGEEQVGMIECGPKREGSYTSADRDLLATLARQAVLAIRNVRLATDLAERVTELNARTDELAASRTRIVQAAEAERRRIERDIHDGVQQQVVALIARLALARTLLAVDPARADSMISEIQDAVRQAHTDLRELARGIHPAVLSDRGLEEAIEARVARLPIGVAIESDPSVRGTRYAQEIEGAAYFLICEGLTNVMKHAAADQATVRLCSGESGLRVEVADTGRGFDPCKVESSGLRGLKDRLEALGGSLEVVAQKGEGTRLIGTLPAREHQLG